MAILDIKNIQSTLKRGQKLMGLDLGTKTIGIALSDVMLTVASPLETIQR